MPDVENMLKVPLTADAHGTIRVGGTRVTLETVLAAFRQGLTAEAIAHAYPTLQLADIYATITYYLNHREKVDSYLHERELAAQRVREEVEKQFDPSGIRERLLQRQATAQKTNASSAS